ncbi:MAG: hypothetical protein ACI9QN_000904, partial [Arcticibacterium sp.]
KTKALEAGSETYNNSAFLNLFAFID